MTDYKITFSYYGGGVFTVRTADLYEILLTYQDTLKTGGTFHLWTADGKPADISDIIKAVLV